MPVIYLCKLQAMSSLRKEPCLGALEQFAQMTKNWNRCNAVPLEQVDEAQNCYYCCINCCPPAIVSSINHLLRWIHRKWKPHLEKGQIHGWWGQKPPLKVNEGTFFSRLNLPMKKKYLSPRSLKDRSFTMFYPFMCFSFLILNLHNFTKIGFFIHYYWINWEISASRFRN